MEAERPHSGGGHQNGPLSDVGPAAEAENVKVLEAYFSDHGEAGSSSAEEEGVKDGQPDRYWLHLQPPMSAH